MRFIRPRRLGALAGVLAVSTVVIGGPAFASQLDQPLRSQTATQTQTPCVVETPPTTGAPAGAQPIKFCASFDKTSYQSSDLVKLTITITNEGTAPLANVWAPANAYPGTFQPYGGTLNSSLFNQGNGVVIQPGATASSEQDGYAADPDKAIVEYEGAAYQGTSNGGAGQAYGGTVDISAPVAAVTGLTYAGVVKTNTSAPLPGVSIKLQGPFDGINGQLSGTYAATTNAQGQFEMTGLPGGYYGVEISAPDSWVVTAPPDDTVALSADENDVTFQANRPLSEVLHASMAFGQSSYHVGDHAQLTITLHNTSSAAITGVQASCDHAGDPNQLTVSEPGWGALGGAGITVGAGQTVTEQVTTVVPVGALSEGAVYVDCLFGPDKDTTTFAGYPQASASAKVLAATGASTTFTVQLVTQAQYGKVAAAMSLNDPSTQAPIAWTFGGLDHNTFTGIPDGVYDLVVSGGWKLASGAADQPINTADITSGGTIDVSVVPDSVKTTPPSSSSSPTSTTASGGGAATTTNAGGASTGGGHPLPFTGVDIVVPVVGALILIGGGLTVMLFVRRRRATS